MWERKIRDHIFLSHIFLFYIFLSDVSFCMVIV